MAQPKGLKPAKMRQGKNDPITIQDFRMWLEGVESMQDNDWTPTAEQWKRIRERISRIKEDVVQPKHSTPVQYYQPQYEQQAPMQSVPSNVQYAPSGLGQMPVAPQGNPLGNGVLFANTDNPTVPVKTPTIDTSNGTYESAFI